MLKQLSSLFLTLLLFCSPALALTIGVPGGQPTIQAGIDAASPGDTVLVQPGRYLENIDFKGKNIVVGSLFLAARDTSYIYSTIIDGNKNGTVVTFKNGEKEKAELCGFTITNGYVYGVSPGHPIPDNGGGINCTNSSPYLHHLIVEGNSSGHDGGGMYLEKSNSVIEYCVIRNNSAIGVGGGLCIESTGNVLIRYSIINNNLAGGGDGIFCINSITNYIKIDHVLLYNNYNSIYVAYSSINITNCTIFDMRNGISIRSGSSLVNIINTIIWTSGKWGIYSYVDPQYPGSVITVTHSDIINGMASVGKGVQDSLYWFDGNISSDPLFLDQSKNNYSLQKGSPCIDSGVASYKIGDVVLINLKKEDYNGNAPDMGAFESDYPLSIVNNNTYNILLSNYPNPFNSKTIINFSLTEPGHVFLSVYNITGQKVVDLLKGNLPAGKYFSNWDGKDDTGNKLASGVYVIRLNAGDRSLSKRIVYMK